MFKGCYSDSVERLPTAVKKTMKISSVGTCQELCYHEKGYQFALKVGIAQDIAVISFLIQITSICLSVKSNNYFYLIYVDEYLFVHAERRQRKSI